MFNTCTMSHAIPFVGLSLPLVVVFRGHHGYNHCNVFSLIISSCMQDSTNDLFIFERKKK